MNFSATEFFYTKYAIRNPPWKKVCINNLFLFHVIIWLLFYTIQELTKLRMRRSWWKIHWWQVSYIKLWLQCFSFCNPFIFYRRFSRRFDEGLCLTYSEVMPSSVSLINESLNVYKSATIFYDYLSNDYSRRLQLTQKLYAVKTYIFKGSF